MGGWIQYTFVLCGISRLEKVTVTILYIAGRTFARFDEKWQKYKIRTDV